MSAQFNKSFVWLWMAALLSASIGVSVQQVYCYCVGKTTISLFSGVDSCNVDKQAAQLKDCCDKKTAQPKRSCCEKPDPSKNGCTKKSTKVFQLRTEYEVFSSDFKKLDTPNYWIESPAPIVFDQKDIVFQIAEIPTFERPPPPISGRMICIRHGVFRC